MALGVNDLSVAWQAKYLRKLPADIADYLAARRLVLEPHRTRFSHRWFWVEPAGVGLHAPRPPPGYRFRQFATADEALRSLKRLGPRHDEAPAVLLAQVSLPWYRVPFGWGRKHLGPLLEVAKSQVALVRSDGAAGVVMHRFAGGLPGATPAGTTHYDVGVWGFGRAVKR